MEDKFCFGQVAHSLRFKSKSLREVKNKHQNYSLSYMKIIVEAGFSNEECKNGSGGKH